MQVADHVLRRENKARMSESCWDCGSLGPEYRMKTNYQRLKQVTTAGPEH